MKWVVDTKNFKGNAKTYLINDACPYTGKTEAEYIEEGYSILNDKELNELINAFINNRCGHWQEISEELFNDMLEVLPPVAWYDGGFFVSERDYGDSAAFYQKFNGKFYTSLQRMSTPRNSIISSLESFVNNG